MRIAILLAVGACSASAPDRDPTPDAQTTVDSAGPSTDPNGCSGAAKQVYVIDENNTFSQFDPVTKQFTDLGQLSCPAIIGTPYSMSIDRNAVAWVLYTDGQVYRVDTTTLACTQGSTTTTALNQFGMGYSTNDPNGTTDTLFIAGGTRNSDRLGGATFAKFDPTAMTTDVIGMLDGWPELTGTSEAQLWGYIPGDGSSRIIEIDKTTGHVLQTLREPTVGSSSDAYAFAAYGGEFFVFSGTEGATKVYEININAAIISKTPTTRAIVGAGVSTCAPVIIE